MKKIKLLLYLMVSLGTININAQWVINPSSPVTNNSAPNWATDTDINNNYIVMTYGTGSPLFDTTFMRIFNNSNNAITGDINLYLESDYSTTQVKISSNNEIYVLGSSSGTQLQLKKYNISGNLISTVNVGTTSTNFNLSLADNNDVLVSYFTTEGNSTPSDVKVNSYNSNIVFKGTLTVATGIVNFYNPTANIKSHFLDYNNGSFVVGYSRGFDSSLTSTIKKYLYNTSSINSSTLQNTYNFSGGFKRFSFGTKNIKQIALRDNGDIFYINGINGVNRISNGSTTIIDSNTNAKVNVDNSNSILISWVDNFSVKANLYNQNNQFIHYYQEDGNINGAWSVAFKDCKFSIIGDKSNLATNFHTNRKPYFQVFNCTTCPVDSPPIIIQFPSIINHCNLNDELELCAPNPPSFTTYSYQWWGPSTSTQTSVLLSTSSCFVPTQHGSYSLIVIDQNGCSNTVTHNFTVTDQLPTVELGHDIIICEGDYNSIPIINISNQGFDNGNFEITWYQNGTAIQNGGTVLQISPTSGTISVVVSSPGCDSQVNDQIEIIQKVCCPEEVNIGIIMCPGQAPIFHILNQGYDIGGYVITWYFNGNVIQNGGEILQLSLYGNGILSVTVEKEGCKNIASDQISISCDKDVHPPHGKEIEKELKELTTNNNLNIYPNPTSDIVNFMFEKSETGKIEIYSLEGKLVFSKEFKEIYQLEASLSDYQDGIYIARITSGENTVTKKIIKK